jgi:A1 cistron-splicing factor AAR2
MSDNLGIIVIPDAPSGLDFGVDLMSYETGEKFKGVSMVPLGLHLVYHSSGMAPRQGFFIFIQKNDIIVRPWDSVNEEIGVTNTLSKESEKNLIESIYRGDLNNNLGPYPYAQHHTWLLLSNFITMDVLQRANVPPGVLIYPGDADDVSTKYEKLQKLSNTITPYFPDTARVARYANILQAETLLCDKICDDNDRIKNISQLRLDASPTLMSLYESYYNNNWDNVLGELQLSFLLFMLIHSSNSLDHWKGLIYKICISEKLLLSNASFTTSFIKLFYSQLNHCPDDFFDNELSKDNFLRPSIKSLLTILTPVIVASISNELQENRNRFLRFIQKKFGLYSDDSSSSPISSQFARTDMSPSDIDILYNLVDEDMPVILSEDEVNEQMMRSSGDDNDGAVAMSTDATFLNPEDKETNIFSWRYPNLYAESTKYEGKEDLLMTAVRIMDNIDIYSNSTVIEAKMFIEYEASIAK